jgi:hypothetical protein
VGNSTSVNVETLRTPRPRGATKRYDAVDDTRGDEEQTVAFLARLADQRDALEFAVGACRIALPLTGAVHGEPGEELRDLAGAHLRGVALVVVENEPADPRDVALLLSSGWRGGRAGRGVRGRVMARILGAVVSRATIHRLACQDEVAVPVRLKPF